MIFSTYFNSYIITKITSMPDDKIHLNVPQYRQTKDYTCVPSCCKMILDYANQFILTDPEPIRDEDEIAKIMNTDITGTIFSDVENINEILTVSIPSLEFIAEFQAHTLADLRKELQSALPSSVWIYLPVDGKFYSHSVVITGMDDNEKTISYNDPLYGKEFTISQSKFMSMWESNGARLIKTKIGRIKRETLEKYMDREDKNE